MLDKDMREPLFDYLDERFGKVRVIEEKIIKDSRADVLAVTDGCIIGIEIKSDNDTYTRLATQIKDYEKYCDRCYLAVGRSHMKHAAEHVPDCWGILVIMDMSDAYYTLPDSSVLDANDALSGGAAINCDEYSDGGCLYKDGNGIVVEVLREAGDNPKVKINNQLSLLWRSELMNIQIRNGIPKYRDKKRTEIYKLLKERLGELQLKAEITEELFERDYTGFQDNKAKVKAKKSRRKKKPNLRVSRVVGRVH